MIYNPDNEPLDLRVTDVARSYVKNENTGNLLNGKWHVQTIGERAEKLDVEVVCTFTVLKQLQDYADEKSRLTVEFLGLTKAGVISGQPEPELLVKGANPIYRVTFVLVVVPYV